MNRANAGAKPTPSPKLPPEAEPEILDALFEGMGTHSGEIAALLTKHGVGGGVGATGVGGRYGRESQETSRARSETGLGLCRYRLSDSLAIKQG